MAGSETDGEVLPAFQLPAATTASLWAWSVRGTTVPLGANAA
jgi:hypothetical protein